jgi:hypothetical protein
VRGMSMLNNSMFVRSTVIPFNHLYTNRAIHPFTSTISSDTAIRIVDRISHKNDGKKEEHSHATYDQLALREIYVIFRPERVRSENFGILAAHMEGRDSRSVRSLRPNQ